VTVIRAQFSPKYEAFPTARGALTSSRPQPGFNRLPSCLTQFSPNISTFLLSLRGNARNAFSITATLVGKHRSHSCHLQLHERWTNCGKPRCQHNNKHNTKLGTTSVAVSQVCLTGKNRGRRSSGCDRKHLIFQTEGSRSFETSRTTRHVTASHLRTHSREDLLTWGRGGGNHGSRKTSVLLIDNAYGIPDSRYI